jgi:hypothetical protein
MFRRICTALTLVILIAPVCTAFEAIKVEGAINNTPIDQSITAAQIAKPCFSTKWDKPALLKIAQQNFEIEDVNERNALAKQLLSCLANPDPKIRDEIAYLALSKWLRSDKLDIESKRLLFLELIDNFGKPIPDELGIYQPFVALVLSEFARADRKSPYLNDKQREILVAKSTEYMSKITDYRGFDETLGWRHNVAHTADIFLQLALNPALTTEQLTRLLNAIGEQVIPQQEHFYTYGESERLAKPLLYIFLQKQHNQEVWKNWLATYITPAPFDDWSQVFNSQKGLSKLHNARAFLSTILVYIVDSKNEQLIMLKPSLIDALDSLP